MSGVARLYITGVLVVGAALAGLALRVPAPIPWPLLALLLALATLAQLHKAEAPHHVLFYASPVFFFAGALLLPPPALVPLIVAPHAVEWARERLRRSPHLRAWYLQPFNMAMYTLATLAAHTAAALVAGAAGPGDATGAMDAALTTAAAWSLLAATLAALCYLLVNAVLLGMALALARGVALRASGLVDAQTLSLDALLVCVGAVTAVVWRANPWMLAPTLAPLVLMYRALLVPQLKREAESDAKTGLATARHLQTLASAELDRAARFGRPLAVLMADLDHFKRVNDAHGHLAGDAVLAAVGRLIQGRLRAYDIAGRFGGEEFMIVLPEVSQHEACAFAERLRRAVEAAEIAPPEARGAVTAPLRVTLSVGVAGFPAHGATPAALTAAADAALYRAKLGGRNRVACADDAATLYDREAV